MEKREYRTIDKASWQRGEWDDEPDKVQWQDETTGLVCLIVRNSISGNLCGYVGVSEGHPLFAKSYMDDGVCLDAHGGLTFSDFCADDGNESSNICHVPAPGEPDRVWWFGFDCAHGFDAKPGFSSQLHKDMAEFLSKYGLAQNEVYRNLSYVKAECEGLALQLATYSRGESK